MGNPKHGTHRSRVHQLLHPLPRSQRRRTKMLAKILTNLQDFNADLHNLAHLSNYLEVRLAKGSIHTHRVKFRVRYDPDRLGYLYLEYAIIHSVLHCVQNAQVPDPKEQENRAEVEISLAQNKEF